MGEPNRGSGRAATEMMRTVTFLDSFSSEEECDIGPAGGWPRSLKDAAAFIMSLTHPAAIFVGSELVVIYNEVWEDTMGSDLKQGKGQSSTLSKTTTNVLRSAIGGDVTCNLTTQDFTQQARMDVKHQNLLCSPMKWESLEGVVIQVLSQQSRQKNGRRDSEDHPHFGQATGGDRSEPNDEKNNNSDNTGNDAGDNKPDETFGEDMALDKQPFFQKFAEMLPTGLAILDHDAKALFVNQHFHELTVHGGTDKSFKKWPQTIHPDDYEHVMKSYRESFESRNDLAIEFRAYGMNNSWRLFLMRPLGDNSLQQSSLRRYGGFICAVIDITSLKAAELSQKKLARDAQERKQQQERFIDMISHEIRNLLSAVLHCTEDIIEAVDYGKLKTDDVPVADIMEACDTVQLCANHQKTLVDDVLSFSKLDASMLSLVPRKSRPKWQMSESLNIFKPQLRKRQIGFDYNMDPSYAENSINCVMADLVRVGQVLVNLISNAIKFTARKDGDKNISVEVGASVKRPTSYPPDVVFFETEEKVHRMDSTQGSDWGNGEAVYIMVAIRDTGIGISSENQVKLFDRFRQATPKTEEMYGGSGLGLNISRKICQLHGGEIGVSSKEGSGSTFGFFFRVRRSEDEADDEGDGNIKLDERKDSLSMPSGMVQDSSGNEKDNPEMLKSPRTEATSNDDDRWQHTAEKTSEMREEHASKSTKEKVKQEKKDGERSRQKGPTETSHRVLFVEDNMINQKILKRRMQSKGFDVVTANNGKEAVDAYKAAFDENSKSGAFDCVLMDQEMPVMDGNGATRAIRAFESEKSLPRVHIVGVSANVREEQQSEMKKAGMDSVLSKPFKVDVLVDRIRSVASAS